MTKEAKIPSSNPERTHDRTPSHRNPIKNPCEPVRSGRTCFQVQREFRALRACPLPTRGSWRSTFVIIRLNRDHNRVLGLRASSELSQQKDKLQAKTFSLQASCESVRNSCGKDQWRITVSMVSPSNGGSSVHQRRARNLAST